MEINQVISREERENTIKTINKYYSKNHIIQKVYPVFFMLMTLLFSGYAAAAAYLGITQHKIYFLHLASLVPMACICIFLIAIRKKFFSAALSSGFVAGSPVTTVEEYAVTADENGICSGESRLLWGDAEACFLVDEYMVITGEGSAWALKADYTYKKQLCTLLQEMDVAVIVLDKSRDHRLLSRKFTFKMLKQGLLMLLSLLFFGIIVPSFVSGLIPQSVEDGILQPQSTMKYREGESLPKLMETVMETRHNFGWRTDVYFDYINQNYNTLIKTTYDTAGNPDSWTVWFFTGGDYLLGLEMGTGDDGETQVISTTKNKAIININDKGGYMIMDASDSEGSLGTGWHSIFRSGLGYHNIVFSLRNFRNSDASMNRYKVTFTSNDLANTASFIFKNDSVTCKTKNYEGKKASYEINFCNTPQETVDATIKLADTLRSKAKLPAETKLDDFRLLKENILSYF